MGLLTADGETLRPGAAARAGRARGPGRPGPRRRAAGRAGGDGVTGHPAAGRRRPGRLPRGAGGADEHGEARGRRVGDRPRRLRADRLSIEVTDTGGTRPPSADAGSGRGLIGLRERLAVYGGTSTPGRASAAGTGSTRSSPWPAAIPDPGGLVSRRRAGRGRRRPGAGAHRLPDDPHRRRHRRGRRGGQRRRGGRRGPAHPARRGADGHPDAGAGRPGGDPAHPGRPTPTDRGSSC